MNAPPGVAGDTPAGYAQPWVVRPGQAVALHASLPRAAQVDLVRIACANAEWQPGGGRGPAERVEAVAGAPAGRHGPAIQPLQPGAQVRAAVAGLPGWRDCAVVIALQRSARATPGHIVSVLAGATLLRIELCAQGRQAQMLRIQAGDDAKSLELPLPAGEWLLLLADFVPESAQGPTATLRVRTALCRASVPDGIAPRWDQAWLPGVHAPPDAPSRIQLGTVPGGQSSADIRVDLVSLLPRELVAQLQPADLLADGVGGAQGQLSPWESTALGCAQSVFLLRACLGKGAAAHDLAGRGELSQPQRPYNAVRGVRWNGRWQGPQQAPAHYTALHFNADALLDANWPPTTQWQVPAGLDSGWYAFRLRPEGDAQAEPAYASFFVTAAGRPRHALAVLLPTFTYLAYANAPEDMRGPPISQNAHAAEQRLDALHPAHGRSIYERHADGQGVLWASSRRPLWSVSPGHRPWGLVADSWLLDWLDAQGIGFDVITDHDLHRLGEEALRPYRVVLTGHHPEYTSTAMWDGLWRYLHGGGRLMYLGGNGFYWRTACDEAAEAIEVRRAEDGTRPSIGAPGEYHCGFTGEYGGLWRRLGRPPQQLVGVGMAAQGFERAAHYRKCPDGHAHETSFVFEGVHGETFGAGGCWGGGASGWEIDRSDAELGTPPGTWWLARSEGHAASMLRTKEELLSYVPPFEDAKARSDMVLVPLDAGDVFAVGSMTWIGSLHGDGPAPTDVATITANVIRRFLDPAPLPRRTPSP